MSAEPAPRPQIPDEWMARSRCPVCGIYYQYRCTYEYLVNGSEDEETLTRLTPSQARAFLAEGEYEALIAFHQDALTHAEAKTRSYAGKCLLSHYLALDDLAAINALLAHPNRDVVYGALSFLASLAWAGLRPPETTALRDRITNLASSSDRPIAERAAYLLKFGWLGEQ